MFTPLNGASSRGSLQPVRIDRLGPLHRQGLRVTCWRLITFRQQAAEAVHLLLKSRSVEGRVEGEQRGAQEKRECS